MWFVCFAFKVLLVLYFRGLFDFIKCFVVGCFGVYSLLLSLIFDAYVVILPLVLICLWGDCVVVSFVV